MGEIERPIGSGNSRGLFKEVPEIIDKSVERMIDDLDCEDELKVEFFRARKAYIEAKLEAVAEHLKANLDVHKADVEMVHPRGNGPCLLVIPSTGEGASKEEIEEFMSDLESVDKFHEVEDWLHYA